MGRVPGDREGDDAPTLGALIGQMATDSVAQMLDTGAALFRQGDTVRDVFVVESGRLCLQRHTVEGVRQILQTAVAGDLLAEASLFAEQYHCDAVAGAPSAVRAVARRKILDALESQPALARSVMAALAGQVIGLRTRLELHGIRSARERVWHHLALAADPDRNVALAAPLKDMAEHLGLTPEALYRTLARLEREGLIAREPGMIRIMRGNAPDVRHRTPCR